MAAVYSAAMKTTAEGEITNRDQTTRPSSIKRALRASLLKAILAGALGGWIVAVGVNMSQARIINKEHRTHTEVIPGTKARNAAIGAGTGAAVGLGAWLVVGTVGIATGGWGLAIGLPAMMGIGAIGGGLAGGASGDLTKQFTWVETIVHNDPAYTVWNWCAVIAAGVILLGYGVAQFKKYLADIRQDADRDGTLPSRSPSIGTGEAAKVAVCLIAALSLAHATPGWAKAPADPEQVVEVRSAPTVNWTPARSVSVEPMKSAASAQPSARQFEWLRSSLEKRIELAEQLGEKGAKTIAKANEWEVLLGPEKRLLPQGPDIICKSPDGEIIVIEAKGGTSPLGHAYGHPQGTPEWAVKSAERVVKSPNASAAEREINQLVLKAAQEGHLKVVVTRTEHVLGEPFRTVVESSAKGGRKAARIASEALDEIAAGAAKTGAKTAHAIEQTAQQAGRTASKIKTAAKVVTVVAFVVDVGVRACDATQVEKDYEAGKITAHERVKRHAENAGEFVGGWGGALAGAEGGAAIGTVVGGPVGAFIGGAIGGIGGYYLGDKGGHWVADEIVDRFDE